LFALTVAVGASLPLLTTTLPVDLLAKAFLPVAETDFVGDLALVTLLIAA